MKKQTFFGGVFVLLVCGIFAKFLGAFYKIPLTWILGAEGLGIYQLVFPIFSLILVFCALSMPTAISRMMASRNSNSAEALQILKISLVFLLVLCSVLCFALILIAPMLSAVQGGHNLRICFLGVAPAVLFVGFISCFRGYFQGKLNMVPTALSNVFEQLFKIVFGLLFAYVFLQFGIIFAVFGALLGISVSELVTLLILWIMFLKTKQKNDDSKPLEKNKVLLKQLLKSFFVISLSNAILPLSIFLDSLLVLGLLQKSGLSLEIATKAWGIESGVVSSITNLPALLGLSVSAVAVPALAKSKSNLNTNLNKSFFSTLFVTVPFFCLILCLSSDVLFVLFGQTFNSFEMDLAKSLLVFSAFSTILLAVLQTQNAVFYGLGKFFVPFLSMFLGWVVKIVVFLLLVSNSNFGIFGVTISKYAFFVVSILFNFVFFKKLNLKLNVFKKLLPNFFACFLMSLSFLCLGFLTNFLDVFLAFLIKLFCGLLSFFVGFYLVSSEKVIKKSCCWIKNFRKKRRKMPKKDQF